MGVALAMAVHVEPVCVTMIGLPARGGGAVRVKKLFCPEKIVIVAEPFPLGWAVMESQGAFDSPTKGHADGSVRIMSCSPPLESNMTDKGLMTGSWHESFVSHVRF